MELHDEYRAKVRRFLEQLRDSEDYKGFALDRYKGERSANAVKGAEVLFGRLGEGDPLGTVELWIGQHAAEPGRYGVRGIYKSKGKTNPSRCSFQVIKPDEGGGLAGTGRLLRSAVDPFVRQAADAQAELRREAVRRADTVEKWAEREVAARAAEAKAELRAELAEQRANDAEGGTVAGIVRDLTSDLEPQAKGMLVMGLQAAVQNVAAGLRTRLEAGAEKVRAGIEKPPGTIDVKPR